MEVTDTNTIIGMGIGKRYYWREAISAETVEVLKEERLVNRREEFISFLDSLPRPIRLVMEASGNSTYLCECLEDLVEEIQIAHPLRTKAIASAKIKTDRIDDWILAHLGLADLVPRSYFPPREVRDLREILRNRAFLVVLQTRLKNQIHSYLLKLVIDTERTDLFGRLGLKTLCQRVFKD